MILSREQYRTLYGEKARVLEAEKTLLVSRPVVFLGFGLRDPDFIYLKDILSNLYKGAARDHFAIVADVVEAERTYWRQNFGIHLVSYETVPDADGHRDHAPLMALLDDLKTAAALPVIPVAPSTAAAS